MRRPDRRSVLGWGAAAAAAPALAACGETAGASRMTRQVDRKPGQKVHLNFWTWVPLQKAVALWNKENPDIQVKVAIIPANIFGGYQKIHSSLKAGNPPDLAQIEFYALPEFMLVNGLTNLSEYGAERLKDSYVDWQWQQGVFSGRLHAMPQASGPMGYYYRQDLFEKWDVDVPGTWDEFRQAALKIKKRSGGAQICSFPPANAQWFAALCWQRGARWFGTDEETDTWVVSIDGDKSLEVADFWDGLIRDNLVALMPETQPPWYRRIQTGQLVSWPAAQWGDALLRGNAPKTAGKWRVSLLPQWEPGGNASSNWGGSSTAIMQGTRHPREALKFAHWLNTDPQSIELLIEAGYGWPAADVDPEDTALGKPDPFFGGQVYNEVFAESDANVDTSWEWAPTTTQSFTQIQDVIAQSVGTGGTLVDALKDAQPRVVDDLEAKGLKARSA